MATANQRIPVLVTPTEKTAIARRAKKAGLSMGEYLRRAAAAYRPGEDEGSLAAMIEQMVLATERAEGAIDDALAFVKASNRRIRRMENQRRREVA